MENFLKRIWLEYPIPRDFSIWGGDGIHTLPLKNLNELIEMSVEDVATDLMIRDSRKAVGIQTQLPDDTVTVMYATMDFRFQGNRQVKVSYDATNHIAMLRYFPASIVFLRKMHVEDVPNLQGDRLIYFRTYVLWKMAETELSFLKTMNMTLDNATIDLQTLQTFMDNARQKVTDLRDSILIYSPTNG
jgi:hypothetical protein